MATRITLTPENADPRVCVLSTVDENDAVSTFYNPHGTHLSLYVRHCALDNLPGTAMVWAQELLAVCGVTVTEWVPEVDPPCWTAVLA
jgi:hypothetical protein